MGNKTEWLYNLRTKIIEDRDKNNFDDLIKCYQNGLLRAGFVMAWLMLVESLKRKIVSLADKEVKVAKEALKTITGTEEAMHSNDEVIWSSAVKCDLITKEEESVIELLWKKRCILSHPYMPNVKECDFCYMVENLVSISLAKTVMWSQNMINDFFEDIKTSLFIIPNTDEGRREYANKILSLIPKKNWPFFWKTLFYEYSTSIETGKRKQIVFLKLLAALFITMPEVNINHSKFTLEKQIKSYCAVCWRLFSLKPTWKKLNKEYQGQLFRYLEDNKEGSNKVLDYAKRLIEKTDDLDNEYLNSYYASLKVYDVVDVERYYIDKDLFLDRLYEEKIDGWQFYDHGQFVEWMKSMTDKEINDYSPQQLRRLGSYMQKSCQLGTFKAQDFVKYHYGDWIKHLDFVKGFVIENCTNRNGNLCLCVQKMDYSFIFLEHLSQERRLEVIGEIDMLPNGEPCNDSDHCYFIKHGMAKQYSEDTPEGKSFKKVVDKYCIAETE